MKEFVLMLVHSDAFLPSWEVICLLTILTLCLLLKTNKMGLIASYLFAYRWGWLVFESSFGEHTSFMYGYLIFGFIALILAVVSMLRTYES